MLPGSRGIGGDGYRFDLGVQGTVIAREELVVVQVARASGAEDGNDQTSGGSSYTSGCLDVRRGRLWLPVNDHQAKPVDVDTSAKHRGG